MIKVKELVELLQDSLWLDLIVENGLSLACEVSHAKHTLKADSRGELEVPANSVYVYEQNIGYAGIYRKCVQVKCTKSI